MKEKFKKYNSDITYLDDKNRIVKEEEASHAIIRETDENGNLVCETFLVRDDREDITDDRVIITKEEYDYLKSLNLVEKDFNKKFIVK